MEEFNLKVIRNLIDRIDLENEEDPFFYDRTHKARNEISKSLEEASKTIASQIRWSTTREGYIFWSYVSLRLNEFISLIEENESAKMEYRKNIERHPLENLFKFLKTFNKF